MVDRHWPLLFLDVDGVVNVLGACGPVERWSFSDGRLLVTPAGIAGRLRELGERFEVVWATTWGADAPDVFGELLGVGSHWPVLDFDDAKWPAILERAGDRCFAWVDDNAASDVPAQLRPSDVAFVSTDELGTERRRGDAVGGQWRGLVLVTDPRIGLDASAGESLRRFAQQSTEGSGR